MLEIPTEAQWEYACRALTVTPWSVAPNQLKLHANLLDARGATIGAQGTPAPWNDGHAIHAPVGSYEPNDFGLFDMHGNVAEWNRDLYSPYGSERAGDGLRMDAGQRYRSLRGGSYSLPYTYSRSAARLSNEPDTVQVMFGVRASRPLQKQ